MTTETLFEAGSSDAVFSPCRTYRYSLTRRWAAGDLLAWVMLNPSIANETGNDPTIGRCIGYARRWGYPGIVAANVFALVSTDPDALKPHPDPIGPDNDDQLQQILAGRYPLIMAGWGTRPFATTRVRDLLERGVLPSNRLHSLGVTAGGHPRHPLYVKGDVLPTPWPAERG